MGTMLFLCVRLDPGLQGQSLEGHFPLYIVIHRLGTTRKAREHGCLGTWIRTII